MEIAPGCEEPGQKAPAREGERSEPGFTVALDLHSSGGWVTGEGAEMAPPLHCCLRLWLKRYSSATPTTPAAPRPPPAPSRGGLAVRDDCPQKPCQGGVETGFPRVNLEPTKKTLSPPSLHSEIASRKNQVHPHDGGSQTAAQPKGPVDASIPPSHPIFNIPHGLHDQADLAERIDGLVV